MGDESDALANSGKIDEVKRISEYRYSVKFLFDSEVADSTTAEPVIFYLKGCPMSELPDSLIQMLNEVNAFGGDTPENLPFTVEHAASDTEGFCLPKAEFDRLVRIHSKELQNTTVNDEEIWKEFLDSQEYRTYIADTYSALEYAIYDMNKDGISELFIESTAEAPVYNTWLFAINGNSVVLSYQFYGYGKISYSQSHNVIMLSPELQPFSETGLVSLNDFFELAGTELKHSFSVGQDNDGYFYSVGLGGKVLLSEGEYNAYLTDLVDLEWISISVNQVSGNDYEHVISQKQDNGFYRYLLYTWYDINHDGSDELLAEHVTCEADRTLDVYTFDNAEIELLGSISMWHGAVYEENGSIFISTSMGYDYGCSYRQIFYDGTAFYEIDAGQDDYGDSEGQSKRFSERNWLDFYSTEDSLPVDQMWSSQDRGYVMY